MRRVVASVALAVVAVLGLGFVGVRPAAAEVQPAELSASDVVIEPGASVSAADRERMAEAARDLRAKAVPTKFVVVANRPVEGPPQYTRDLRRAIGFNGNVLVLSLSPRSLGIASSLSEGEIQQVFNRSVSDLRADPIGGTIAVGLRLSEAVNDEGVGGGGGVGRGLFLFGLLVLGTVGLVAFSRRATRRRAEADLADRRAALEPMVDALAAHITDLGADLRLGGDRAGQAQPYYDDAVLAYGEVRDSMPAAVAASALDPIRLTLERGLRSAVSARATLDGRPLPPPEETALLEGLCAFDPKHGRAVREMPVVTPSGNEAQVPVCATCAAGLEQGEMPDVRRVYQRGMAVPYWQGAGSAGFGGGLFPMFGGFLGGMVLHDLFTPDVNVIEDQGDFGDSGDGGDWGDGGDGGWGGGDFDGGDFGGGGDF
jgi:hypothetical protein